jgi:hypothetical protein
MLCENKQMRAWFSLKKWKRKFPHILFFGGFFITVFAFFGDHAEDMPFVYEIIAPSYYHAENGMQALIGYKRLNGGDEGFSEISSMLISGLQIMGDTKMRNNEPPHIEISDIKNTGQVTLVSGDESMTGVARFTYTVSNSFPVLTQSGTCNFRDLRHKIDQLRVHSILPVLFFLFFFGSAIEMVAFFREASEKASRPDQDTTY